MAYWRCAFCAFSAVLLHLLLTHINPSHNDDEQFFVYCGIMNARQDFEELIH